MLDASLPVAPVQVEDHLRVAVGPEAHALLDERAPQRRVVVDLAVEDQADPVVAEHRLRAVIEVDDRQAAMPEAKPAIRAHEQALAVRATVVQRLPHAEKDFLRNVPVGAPVLENADYPAHGLLVPPVTGGRW